MIKRPALHYLFALVVCAMPAGRAEAYITSTRWTGTASGSAGSQGSPITLTWSIVPDGTDVPDVNSNLRSFLDANWGVGPGGADLTQRPWFPVFQAAFDRLGALSGVRYVYEPKDDGAGMGGNAGGVLGVRGDVRIGGKSYGAGSNTLATNYYPQIGDMMINTDRNDFFTTNANNFRYFRNTIMHEAMHGLGVDHVDSPTGILMRPFISSDFDGPQLDDVLALQRLYGDVREKNGGNDTAATATSLGTVFPGTPRIVGTLGNLTTVTAAQTDFASIDDNLDSDYYSFTLSEAYNVFLLVQAKGATYNVGPQGGAQTPTNTKNYGNLGLVLVGSNGLTSLASVDAAAAGGSESIQFQLEPGTYYARVKGTDDNVQLYQLSISASAIPADTLTWVGNASAQWNVATTANFANASGADVFRNGDVVTFNDTTAVRSVNIQSPVAPGSVLVDTDGTYVFTGAGVTAGALTVDGGVVELANSGNTYGGTTSVSAGTLKITGNANAMVSAINVAGGATLILDATDAASMLSPITIQPGGTLQVGTADSAANVLGDAPLSLVNNGLMRLLDSESVANLSGAGQVAVERETAEFADNAAFSGGVVVHAGAVADARHANAFGTAAGATTVQAGGSVLISANAAFQENFVLAGDGGGAGALHVGPARNVMFAGEATLASAATVRIDAGSTVAFSGPVTADGAGADLMLQVDAGSAAALSGALQLGAGRVTKRGGGAAAFSGNVQAGAGATVEAGLLQLAGAGDLAGVYQVNAGAVLEIAGAHDLTAASALVGGGLVRGDVATPGAVAPGGGTTGVLTFDDSLTLAAAADLQIDLAGLIAGTDYDVVAVDGDVSLDGALAVALGGGFMPALGATFTIVEGAAVSGEFASTALPALDAGLAWEIDYTATEVVLAVIEASSLAAADFNGDGAVDAADLALWTAGFGDVDGGRGDGDATGDQAVDGNDFLAWQQQLSPPGGGAPAGAIPEPSSWLLAAAAGILAWRRRAA
jgi:autotransporter-associated beta strand protein